MRKNKRYYSSEEKRKHRKRAKIRAWIGLILMLLVFAAIKIVPHYLSNIHASELAKLEYNGEIAVEVNNNKPEFTDEEKTRARSEVFEEYSELDSLGRCGPATANICRELMPGKNDERESLTSITPSGWRWLNFWNRAHLIGYQLAGENANERNLITGTRRMNVIGMLAYENEVASYVRMNKGKHVLMRVEPVFTGRELVARGVHMQAWSVEDNGRAVSFNVYIFNIQPGYIIDYFDGAVRKNPSYQSKVTLNDDTARYTGKPVSVAEAEVSGSTGNVSYIYYTDKATKNRTSEAQGAKDKGGPPSKKGTYYVLAIVSEDNWYAGAVSKPAKLVIY